MAREIEGELVAANLRLGMVVARFNNFITEKLVGGALDTIRRHGGDPDKVALARVPGSLELAVVARKMAQSGNYDAIICVGSVIRGSTGHYDCVVEGTTQGITHAALETGVPIIFGVITTDTIEQAIERAGSKMGNAGSSAALSAIEMANLMKKL
jgi:6,7-dimethyl-8-ribityllumazine synthase